ncbi:MAG: biotin--[Tyzzerella sp.]|nr:biotin--[acetyl-CoA-carboxylase] ligase [Tyzzerella sp.]
MEWNVVYYEEIDSTNTQAKRMAKEGAEQGLVVTADEQSAGKGRRGRVWESPAGTNLYFSILLRPELEPDKAPMLTLVMAYSVAVVLRTQEGLPVEIKWPNDLVLEKKKICGILTEMELSGSQIADVVIGVGINVNTTEFPEELRDKATSLYLQKGEQVEREKLLQQILEKFRRQYERFLEIQDLSFLQNEYNQMLINKDREVLVLEPGHEYQAQALGINEKGELLVKKSDGSTEAVFAGEVSVRGIYGYI